jgi:hypothetical protein
VGGDAPGNVEVGNELGEPTAPAEERFEMRPRFRGGDDVRQVREQQVVDGGRAALTMPGVLRLVGLMLGGTLALTLWDDLIPPVVAKCALEDAAYDLTGGVSKT